MLFCYEDLEHMHPEDDKSSYQEFDVNSDHELSIVAGKITKIDDVEINNHLKNVEQDSVRRIRSFRLSEMDQVLTPIYFAAMTQQKRDEWLKYRQDLLDITTQTGFPFNVIWPKVPTR